MTVFSCPKWMFGWLLLCSLPVWGQTEQTFQTYFDQGHRHEQQGNYRKALDAYGKALNYTTATTRPTVQQAISHVDELIQQQTLVIESQTKEIRKVMATISSATNRDRIQSELVTLQQRENTPVAAYKALLRKANTLKQVEINIEISDDVVSRPESHPHSTTPDRRPARPKPTLFAPPPKTITSSMPGTPKEGVRSKIENKATKSVNDDLH